MKLVEQTISSALKLLQIQLSSDLVFLNEAWAQDAPDPESPSSSVSLVLV